MTELSVYQERFWSKVNILGADDCWEWTGCKSEGYGRFQVGNKLEMAHRLSYKWKRGEIPSGMTIDHLCRNRACVNPAHLEVVSIKENVLRGVGLTAINSKVTHCPHGHPYNKANTYLFPNGGRSCRICRKQAKDKFNLKLATGEIL